MKLTGVDYVVQVCHVVGASQLVSASHFVGRPPNFSAVTSDQRRPPIPTTVFWSMVGQCQVCIVLQYSILCYVGVSA